MITTTTPPATIIFNPPNHASSLLSVLTNKPRKNNALTARLSVIKYAKLSAIMPAFVKRKGIIRISVIINGEPPSIIPRIMLCS